MTCQECRKEMGRMVEGNLQPGIREEVARHLSSCNRCAAEIHLLRMTEHLITEEIETGHEAHLVDRVLQRINSIGQDNNVREMKMTSFRPMLVAASIILAVTLGVASGYLYHRSVDKSTNTRQEMALLDDVFLESLDMIGNE